MFRGGAGSPAGRGEGEAGGAGRQDLGDGDRAGELPHREHRATGNTTRDTYPYRQTLCPYL